MFDIFIVKSITIFNTGLKYGGYKLDNFKIVWECPNGVQMDDPQWQIKERKESYFTRSVEMIRRVIILADGDFTLRM
jgi:hypothetical protein